MPNPHQPDLEALNAYIAEVRDTPFQWHNFDCFMFTNTAFQRIKRLSLYLGKIIKNMKRQETNNLFSFQRVKWFFIELID